MDNHWKPNVKMTKDQNFNLFGGPERPESQGPDSILRCRLASIRNPIV